MKATLQGYNWDASWDNTGLMTQEMAWASSPECSLHPKGDELTWFSEGCWSS